VGAGFRIKKRVLWCVDYSELITSSIRRIIVAASVADSTASRLTAAGSRFQASKSLVSWIRHAIPRNVDDPA